MDLGFPVVISTNPEVGGRLSQPATRDWRVAFG